MLAQKFSISANKGIKDGSWCSYEIDTDKWTVTPTYDLELSWYVPYPSQKNPVPPQTFPVAHPELLLSANINTAGQVIPIPLQIGGGQTVNLVVAKIEGTVATCTLDAMIQGYHVTGSGQVDLSGQYVALISATANGTVFGLSVIVTVSKFVVQKSNWFTRLLRGIR